jgi:hypothetical protein
MLLCRPLRQVVNSSGGRVENAASVPVSGQAAEVQVRAEQPVIRAAARTGDPLHDVAGEIDDVDARLVVPELGQEEGAPMARRVRRDEERVGPSEARARHERETARRRQRSLAGRRSRTSNSTSGGILSELAAARARMARVVGGAITEAYGDTGMI